MYKPICCKIIFCLMVFFTVISCSTTRVIPEGRSRLAKNKIEVLNSKVVTPASLQHCIKQKPNNYLIFGWNPFLNVYNWSTGSNSWWDRDKKWAMSLFDTTFKSNLVNPETVIVLNSKNNNFGKYIG